MEYQKHKCCDRNCDCFEISRIMGRIKVLSFYQVYNVAKESFVFSFGYLSNNSVGRVSRNRERYMNKELPPNTDHSSDTEGIPESWTQAPPLRDTIRIFQRSTINDQRSTRNTFRIFRQELIGHQDISRIVKFPTVHGVRGVINAPPSARKRNYVHELIHRENQTKSISI